MERRKADAEAAKREKDAPTVAMLARRWPWMLAPMMLAGAGYVRRPYRRLLPLLPALSWRDRAVALAWVPAIRVIGDVAKMLGYPVGWWWRLRHGAEIPPGHPRR